MQFTELDIVQIYYKVTITKFYQSTWIDMDKISYKSNIYHSFGYDSIPNHTFVNYISIKIKDLTLMQLLLNACNVLSEASLTDSLMSSRTRKSIAHISLILSTAEEAGCLRKRSERALQHDSRTLHKLCVKLLIRSFRIG